MQDKNTVLLTGGTGQLGGIFLQHLLAQGHRVVFTGRRAENVEALLRRWHPFTENGKLQGIAIDLSADDSSERLLSYIDADLQWQVDTVVHNARNSSYLSIEEDGMVKRNNWQAEYLLDVVVPYELTMALVMRPGNKIRNVIHIGSMYGCVPPNPSLYENPATDSPIHYGVAKAALIHLTKELAIRLAPNIRVNAISFGGVEGRVDEAFAARYAKLCPARRMLSADDVVEPLEFLIAKGSKGMTGHNLVVDGGFSVW